MSFELMVVSITAIIAFVVFVQAILNAKSKRDARGNEPSLSRGELQQMLGQAVAVEIEPLVERLAAIEARMNETPLSGRRLERTLREADPSEPDRGLLT